MALAVNGHAAPARDAVAPPAEALLWWRSVLQQFVDDAGRTDFDALSREPADLQRFVNWLARVGPQTRPEWYPRREDVLAYHINAYNALAMQGIVARGIPPDFNSFLKKLRFFKLQKFELDGASISLYDYEHDVLRPLGEPRMHFALNCMVRSCPRLPREPFRADTLERDLEAVTREFFAQPQNLKVADAEREVWVSEILDFYTEDFVASGEPQDLLDYISRYVEHPVPADYRVRFIEYDWRVNRQP